jgi:hypothetical protein
MAVYFLSQNAVTYLDPVYDPLFYAARPTNYSNPGAQTYYLSNYYVNPMICADQYVLCNPAKGACSSAVGLNAVYSVIGNNILGFNDAQSATAIRISNSLGESGSWNSVMNLGEGCKNSPF